jgi:hypothetical protein
MALMTPTGAGKRSPGGAGLVGVTLDTDSTSRAGGAEIPAHSRASCRQWFDSTSDQFGEQVCRQLGPRVAMPARREQNVVSVLVLRQLADHGDRIEQTQITERTRKGLPFASATSQPGDAPLGSKQIESAAWCERSRRRREKYTYFFFGAIALSFASSSG